MCIRPAPYVYIIYYDGLMAKKNYSFRNTLNSVLKSVPTLRTTCSCTRFFFIFVVFSLPWRSDTGCTTTRYNGPLLLTFFFLLLYVPRFVFPLRASGWRAICFIILTSKIFATTFSFIRGQPYAWIVVTKFDVTPGGTLGCLVVKVFLCSLKMCSKGARRKVPLKN